MSGQDVSPHIKQQLICEAVNTAIENHGTDKIYPVGDRTLDQCFTIEEGMILFWYDVVLDEGITTGAVWIDTKKEAL